MKNQHFPIIKFEVLVLTFLFISCYKVSSPITQPCTNCSGGIISSAQSNPEGYTTKTLGLIDSDWTVDSLGIFETGFPGWSDGLPGPSSDYYFDHAIISYLNTTIQLGREVPVEISGGILELKGRRLYFTPGTSAQPPTFLSVTLYMFLL